MSLKTGDWLTLALFGGSALLLMAPSIFGGTRVIRSGKAVLVPGIPYRLTFQSSVPLTDYPLSTELSDRQQDVRVELITLSAYDIAFGRQSGLSGGEYLLAFTVTPLMSVVLTVGDPLSAAGTYGPQLRLLSVERLDGKSF